MISSKILVSVIIVLLIGIAAAGYQITSNPTGISSLFGSQSPATTDQGQTGTGTSGQGSSGQNQIGSGNSASNSGQSSSGQSGTGGGSVKISSTEAQSLAQKAINQLGAEAGTPKLNTWNNGKKVYVVPIVSTSNGTNVGEVVVDASSGKIVEGAGGAP